MVLYVQLQVLSLLGDLLRQSKDLEVLLGVTIGCWSFGLGAIVHFLESAYLLI